MRGLDKKQQHPTNIVKDALLVDTTATPAQIQRNCVMSALGQPYPHPPSKILVLPYFQDNIKIFA